MKYELNMLDYLDYADSNDSDIGLDKNGYFNYEIFHDIIMSKKDFLKSAPQLGDYVPTNEEGEVMEKPNADMNIKSINDREEYQSALDRRLWDGWEVKGYSDTSGKTVYIWLEDGNGVNELRTSNIDKLNDKLSKTTYDELITSGVKLERIQKK